MMKGQNQLPRGILFVALGAALWGTDAIFRRGLALDLPATTVVLLEHLVLVAATAPVLWRARAELRALKKIDWLAALAVGAGSSALATVMFTAAFRYGDPTTPLLLQKVQPLVAIAGASLILGERLVRRYLWFLLAGMTGAFLVAFSDPTDISISESAPALLAVGAASLWGLGTVFGRHLASKLNFLTMTSLRFAIALPVLGVATLLEFGATGLQSVDMGDASAVVVLALVPGLAALLIYYRGLGSTPASVATLAELAFPLSAIGLNYMVFGTALAPTQWLGVLLLATTITAMTWFSQNGQERALGVRLPRPAMIET